VVFGLRLHRKGWEEGQNLSASGINVPLGRQVDLTSWVGDPSVCAADRDGDRKPTELGSVSGKVMWGLSERRALSYVNEQEEPAKPAPTPRDRVVVRDQLRQRLLEMIQRNESHRREDQREESSAK